MQATDSLFSFSLLHIRNNSAFHSFNNEATGMFLQTFYTFSVNYVIKSALTWFTTSQIKLHCFLKDAEETPYNEINHLQELKNTRDFINITGNIMRFLPVIFKVVY